MIRLILLEAFVLGLVATGLGVLGGIAMSWYAVEHGIDYSGFLGGAETYEAGGVVVSTLIKGAWNWPKTAVYATVTVIFSVLSAIYPAWSATRMKPVDAMRHP